MLLDEVRWNMGLWIGCYDDDGTEVCKTDVFENTAFHTGNAWHIGSRVTMSLALAALFFLLFPLIGYACIKPLEKYNFQLIILIIAVSLLSALCHSITLILYGSNVAQFPDSWLKGSFGIVVICFLLDLVIPVLVSVDKRKRSSADELTSETTLYTGTHSRVSMSPKPDITGGTISTANSMYTIGEEWQSVHTSTTTLSEQETYKKYAYLDLDADQSVISIGSARSLNARSSAYNNVSYIPDDIASVESAL